MTWSQSLVVTFDRSQAANQPNGWDRVRTIMVRAGADNIAEPEQTIVISHSLQSSNPLFNNVAISNVYVDRIDSNTPSLIVTQTPSNTQIVEGLTTATYTVALTKAPAAGETVTVHLQFNTSQLTVSAANPDPQHRFNAATNTLTFDAGNWQTPFALSVAGSSGPLILNPVESDIFHSVTSSGSLTPVYGAVADTPEVKFQLADSRVGSVIIQESNGSTVVSAGHPDAYTIQLSKAPIADVVVSILDDGLTLVSSADARFNGAGAVPTVTFHAGDTTPITITVSINPNPPVVQGQPQLKFAAQPQTTSLIQGPLIIEGDVIPSRNRTLTPGVKLPTELDTSLPVLVDNANNDPAHQTNTLNVFNAGSNTGDTGVLHALTPAGVAAIAQDYAGPVTASEFANISGLNMGSALTLNYGTQQAPRNFTFDGGITYHNVQVVDVMLGRGNDTFTVNTTTPNSINVIQGGGGNDHLIATAHVPGSALVLLGDTTQDGSFYNSTTQNITGSAREFNNPGNDTLDASADSQPVVLYGGAGNDVIFGGSASDWIAGGGGNDTISSGNGNDIVLGDDGFNLNLSARLDLSTQVLLTVNAPSPTDDQLTSDKLIAGSDSITGGNGNDIVIGDHGIVTQIPGTNRILTTGLMIGAQTVRPDDGAGDTINLGTGNNVVLGGSGADTINATSGNDVIVGDNGNVVYSVPGVLMTVRTTDVVGASVYGGDDTITVGAGHDVILGGTGNDTITVNGTSNSIAIGDEGQINYDPSGNLTSATTTNPSIGGDDKITLAAGNNIVFGGYGNDTIIAGTGNQIAVGDNGSVVCSAPDVLQTVQTSDPLYGGNDTITMADGNDLILGGIGADIISVGNGNSTIIGDDGILSFTAVTGLLVLAQTQDPSFGGNDQITAGNGINNVIGGAGNDKITTGNGGSIVIGDNGKIVWSTPNVLSLIVTTDFANFGNDTITTGSSRDVILGGGGADTINGGDGNNIVVGDDGQATYTAAGLLSKVETTNQTAGGNDTIATGVGQDLIFGGFGSDSISAGDSNDIVVGDDGYALYATAVVAPPVGGLATPIGALNYVTITNDNVGGDDTIYGQSGDDILVGGAGNDAIDGGLGQDLIFGDNVTLDRTGSYGNLTNPRFRALTGTTLYDGNDQPTVTSVWQLDPAGAPLWSDFRISMLDMLSTTPAGYFGTDYIAGGGGNDQIFGQLGNDVIQGDGSIDTSATGGVRVSAIRDASNALVLHPSFDAAADGSDYIEGGGGTDTIFGNQGQDDIIGGNSNLFGLSTPALRPDGSDMIFGGSGTAIGLNDSGNTTAAGHSADSDTILGDNGVIYRLVGVNGVQNAPAVGAGTVAGGIATYNGYLSYNYDNTSATAK